MHLCATPGKSHGTADQRTGWQTTVWRTAGRAATALFAALGLAGQSAAHDVEIADASRLYLEQQKLNLPGDVEIVVGNPDPRLRLAPCARYEPFVPAGTRLMGKTMVGVRCVDGATWSIYLPVQIKVFVPAIVAARALVAGQTIGSDDVRTERVDLGASPAGVLTTAAQYEGHTLTRGIVAGQPLRRDMLRAQAVVQAGDSVKLVYTGTGFTVSTEGKAAAQAANGQIVPIRTESGKVVNGIARSGGIAEVPSL